MRSIQSRLGIGFTVSLVAVFALQWLVVSVTVRNASEAGMITHIEHDIDILLAGLSFDAAGRLSLAPDHVEKYYLPPFSGNYFRVVSGDQVLRSRSLWDQDLPGVTLAAGRQDSRRIAGPRSQSLLLYTRAFELRGRHVIVSVSKDLAPVEQDIRLFRNRYALVSAAALALLLALQAWLVRQGLRPLRTTRAELERLERGEIDSLDENVPAELRPLVKELNTRLLAMKQRLARSRQALGNLAHAMKTPLTLLTHQAADERLRGAPDLSRGMTAQIRTMKQLVDRELKRARLSGAALPGARFDIAAELPALIETLRSLYRDKELDITSRLPPAAVLPADREDMLELLGNLLDNACKWARGRVRVEVDVAATGIALRVHDDGPGCPPEALAQLARRGARLDESAPGHGLGLAIAMDITASYDGTLRFGRSGILGGFLVIAELPSREPASAIP